MVEFDHKPLEYDAEFEGPLRRRSCTDVPCLVIFLAFILSWVGLGIYAFSSGNVKTLLAPTDSEGRRCGLDAQVSNKPYLFFFDLTKCDIDKKLCDTPQVCLEKCPGKNWIFNASDSLEHIRESIICRAGVDVTNKDINEIEHLIKVTACAPMYFKGKSIVHRCFPLDLGTDFIDDILLAKLKKSEAIIKSLAYVQGVFDKVKSSYGAVLGIICGGAVMCIIYMLLLRWIALPVVCITIFAVCALLVVLACLSYQAYAQTSSALWLIAMIIIICSIAVIVLVTLCSWQRIYLASQLIKEASKAIMSVLSSIFFPIIPWLFHIGLLVYFFYVIFLLMSIKKTTFAVQDSPNGLPESCQCLGNINYTSGDSCEPKTFDSQCKERGEICISRVCRLQRVVTPAGIVWAYFIHIIGGLWLGFFISAVGDMTLANTFATWYWTINKNDVTFFTVTMGFWRTVRFHLGTIAFGSFLITVCRIFRLVMEYLQSMSDSPTGGCAACIRCFIPCLLALLERFVKFMTGNAYIICAIYGKGLCDSAEVALGLVMRNILRTSILNQIVSWVLLAGKVLVTCMMVAIAWCHYRNQDDQFWWAPTLLVGVGTFLVASVFFSVHSMAVDTIFLCFLEDSERNDGSEEKPYFMTRPLAKLLNKK
ncbi:choline transporter-like 2 [Diachasmimorpha longicaudata]|uniref:choline transporter-like 2 n=1 Tax=Diachasmimorpha longicaudata TaxID=58733 RepID=UPI0030B86AA1